MKRTYTVLALVIVVLIFSYALAENQKKKTLLGGICEYRLYPGMIRVLDIEKTERSKLQSRIYGGPDYEGYEITYKFISDKDIEENFAKERALKTQTFRLLNSWFPSKEYLIKNNIEKDKSYPASMMVIEKGTCTPVLFEIEGWERD
jgi:hypothetical protein